MRDQATLQYYACIYCVFAANFLILANHRPMMEKEVHFAVHAGLRNHSQLRPLL